MSIIIDLGIILLVVLFAFIGYRQGLVKSIIKILAFIIAIIITILIYKPVAEAIITNTNIDERLANSFVQRILPEGASADTKVDMGTIVPNKILHSGIQTANEVGRDLSRAIIEAVTFILLYLVIRMILKVVTLITDVITKIPILKQFNELRRIVIWDYTRKYYYICYICVNIINRAITRRRVHYGN